MAPGKKGRPKGRPRRVFSDREINQVEALSAVLSIDQIADYFKIAQRTFYNAMERQPELYASYKAGKARAIEECGEKLFEKIRAGNLAAIIFYLKTQGGWRETDRPGENDSDKPHPVQVELVVKNAKKCKSG